MTDPLFAELLDRPLAAALTTVDPDGSPRSVIVWCDREDDRISLSAGDGLWLRNVRRDPRLALAVYDDANILRYVAIRGRVTELAPDTDYAHIDRLSQLYEGRRYQYTLPQDAPRFKVSVAVVALRTHDYSAPPTGLR